MSQRKDANRSQVQQSSGNLEDSIKECVRYILCREGSKIPIKRAEIINHLKNVCQTPPNQINSVIIEADRKLKRIYGYKLVQVEAKSGIQYIVVLMESCESTPSSLLEGQHRKLLVASLLHIFMTGGPVKEDDMWKFLHETGLLDENDHNGRKTLTNQFTRQMYLQYSKVGEGDLARSIFEWGQRASLEVPKMYLLDKMAKAFNKSPDHWCEQYKEAIEENHA